MNQYKKLKWVFMIFILALLFSCTPKKEIGEGEPAILIKDTVKIFKSAKSGDLIEEYKNNWKEVGVLNKDKPEMELINNTNLKKWFMVKYGAGSKIGWIIEDDFVFQEFEPVKAVIGHKTFLYDKPDSWLTSSRFLAISENINFLGYKYSDGNREFNFISFGNNEKGWVISSNWIIPQGAIGVADRESTLFTGTKDIEDYAVKDMKLNEFDIVLVYPEEDNGFISIGLMQYPNIKKYYIKKNKLSFSSKDLTVAMKVNKDYEQNKGYKNFIDSKEIVAVVEEALKTEDALAYIDEKISNIAGTIAKLGDVKTELKTLRKDNEMSSSIGYFLDNYLDKLDSTIAELEKISS